MTEVVIAGIGQTEVGEHWGISLRELAYHAIRAALQDSGELKPQALFAGNMLAPNLSNQAHLGALLTDYAGLTGIEAVTAGTAQIGTSSRDLKPEEGSLGLVDTPIAYDGIAVIVSPENPVSGLTSQQLRDVFAGKITNWREVGGKDQAIDLVKFIPKSPSTTGKMKEDVKLIYQEAEKAEQKLLHG